MFHVPTVFVIGAGASNRWGFSVGDTLRREIATQLGVEFTQDGLRIGDSTEVVDSFVNSTRRDKSKLSGLLRSMRSRMYAYSSIDEFIDAQQNDELTELAKLSIAYVIGRQEDHAEREHFQLNSAPETFAERMSSTWLGIIATQMASGVRVTQTPENIGTNVGFIIFNYDRSIEYFLHRWIADLGLGVERAAEIVGKMPIFHPYGTIGQLPWQAGSRRFAFGRIDDLVLASDSIRTFTEQVADSNELARIRLLVEEATRLVFLGFGFHRQNMELLAPKQLRAAKHVFGTAYLAPKGEIRRINEAISSRFKLFAQPDLQLVTCDEFASSNMKFLAS